MTDRLSIKKSTFLIILIQRLFWFLEQYIYIFTRHDILFPKIRHFVSAKATSLNETKFDELFQHVLKLKVDYTFDHLFSWETIFDT